jgi:hypothetical protein
MNHIVREVEELHDLQLRQGIIADSSSPLHPINISPKREQDTCMVEPYRCRKGSPNKREIADDGDRELDFRGREF